MIDYLECTSENFMPCVDIAAKSKLFSVIVDTMETAKQVLEANKAVKGGVINVYPLETLDQVAGHQRLPVEGTKSLLDIVKLKPGADGRLQNLVSNIFGKVVLVRNYEQAM